MERDILKNIGSISVLYIFILCTYLLLHTANMQDFLIVASIKKRSSNKKLEFHFSLISLMKSMILYLPIFCPIMRYLNKMFENALL